MSFNLNILKDAALDIDVSIIKRVRKIDPDTDKTKSEIAEIVPIDLSAILELKIEDSLMQHGLRGVITVNNKGKILDKLKISAGSPNDLYIKYDIVDEELNKLDEVDAQKKISFLAMVRNTSVASANIEDNIITFEFEESVISEMKYTSWASLLVNNDNLDEDAKIDVIKLVDEFYRISLSNESEEERITVKAREEGVSDDVLDLASSFGFDANTVQNVVDNAPNYSDNPSLKIPVGALQEINVNQDSKVYQVFRRLLRQTTINSNTGLAAGQAGPVNTPPYQLPLFRFVNTSTGRKMQFKALMTDRHREFLKAIINETKDANTSDYSDVYLEKFNIGPFAAAKGLADKNTSWQNTIETHSIERPDAGTLREDVWGNYCLVGATEKEAADLSAVEIDYVLYSQAMDVFINHMLKLVNLDPDKNVGINLPILEYKTQARFLEYRKGSQYDEEQAAAMFNQAFYKLLSSFVTVNEQLHFTVKGKTYRQPGKFIIVDRGEDEPILEQIWFVSSITHVIENGKYSTEFICNRFFGNLTAKDVKAYYKENYEDLQAGEAEIIERQSIVQQNLNDGA